ncbi:Fic family protein [Streptosporangium subroseum]|uniref:Fic family protein n=1 Tax=Streptosporangium subroseum TaxID=106412 RepID=UPI001C5310A6|nr:Fic family protein [Streptosporangium subroseum]
MRAWYSKSLDGVRLADPEIVGKFRGEGVGEISVSRVQVGGREACQPHEIASELSLFEKKLGEYIKQLDAELPSGEEPPADTDMAIIEACAFAHGEWVRIHPFPNSNGTTARLWANWVVIRYGLPAFVRVKPRPDSVKTAVKGPDGEFLSAYGLAGNMSMIGRHAYLKKVLVEMLIEERYRLSKQNN